MDKVIMSANQVEKWIDSPEEEMRRIQMTPELALKIKTTRNGHNRPLYPKTAENYTIAMKHGIGNLSVIQSDSLLMDI